MYDPSPSLSITRSNIRPQVQRIVILMNANSHFNLPQGFVYVQYIEVNILRYSQNLQVKT